MTRSANPPEWPPVRHPFEVAAIVAFLTTGILGLAGAGTFTLAQFLSGPLLIVWLVGLVLSASLGGVAVVAATRRPILSLLCERLFLVGVGSFATLYVVAAIARDGLWNPPSVIPGTVSTVFSVVMFTAYAVGAFWRLWQVQTYLHWWFKLAADAKGGTT